MFFWYNKINKPRKGGLGMEERRMTIPKELLDRSNLKEANKILLTLVDGKILLVPYKEEWDGLQVLGSRALDEKGRFFIPAYLHISPNELITFLSDGEIWITRHI